MKIIVVCEAVFPENKGGIERWLGRLAQYFAEQGHSVSYFNSAALEVSRNNVHYRAASQVKWSYLPGGVRSRWQALRFGYQVYKFVRSEEADIVYCSSVPIFSIFGAWLGSSNRAKLFVEWFEVWPLRYWCRYLGVPAGILGWTIQFLAAQLGEFRIVYTNNAKTSLRRLALISKKNVNLLPGLCPDKPTEPTEIESCEKSDIYFLGRLVEEKQPHLALDAIQTLVNQGWNGIFWIIGTGPLAASLKIRIETQGLSNFVNLVENPSDETVIEIARKCFALLHPSRREGYGLASVEAAYLGIPSILINYPDNYSVSLGISPELVSEPQDIDQLVRNIYCASSEQRRLREATLDWALFAQRNLSASKTFRNLGSMMKLNGYN
jgi:glycosyltransferase involved in cell wall biosynthesis